MDERETAGRMQEEAEVDGVINFVLLLQLLK